MARIDVKTGKAVYSVRLDKDDADKLLWLCYCLECRMVDIFRYLVRDKAEKMGFQSMTAEQLERMKP